MGLTTILGAGGAVGTGLARLLADRGAPLRLVSRTAAPVAGAEVVAADLTDRERTVAAVAGSEVVHLLAGLKYDHRAWAEHWPRIMENVIEACKRAGARLVFFDNVYMYGAVAAPMTEETPYRPVSRKGEVRARIARRLEDEMRSGGLTAMIARSADFYGPGAGTGIPNVLVFGPLARGRKASWLGDDRVPHSFTYTPDAARGLAMLAGREDAWNRVWHLPTAPEPPTGRDFVAMAAAALGVRARHRVLGRRAVWLAGWFDPVVGELHEMLYQNDRPYIFDSSRFARAFGFAGTPYAEGIRITAGSYRRD